MLSSLNNDLQSRHNTKLDSDPHNAISDLYINYKCNDVLVKPRVTRAFFFFFENNLTFLWKIV
jgi:hypothetical protein